MTNVPSVRHFLFLGFLYNIFCVTARNTPETISNIRPVRRFLFTCLSEKMEFHFFNLMVSFGQEAEK
jgi:hypothetical protein